MELTKIFGALLGNPKNHQSGQIISPLNVMLSQIKYFNFGLDTKFLHEFHSFLRTSYSFNHFRLN
jgi:hypothetical protein